MSREFWFEFIQIYRSLSCLWDTKDPLYLRKDVRKQAYEALLTKVQEIDPTATVDMVKKKIDSLRTSFRREEKKVLFSMQSGATDDEVYSPTLWYYKELEEFLGYSADEAAKRLFNSDDDSPMFMEQLEILSDDSDGPAQTGTSTPPPKKRSKIIDRRPSKIFAQYLPLPPTRPTEVEDDCSTFAANLKYQMREITKEQKYIAQKLISDVMFLARTGRLTYNSTVTPNLTYKTVTIPKKVTAPDILPSKTEEQVSATTTSST